MPISEAESRVMQVLWTQGHASAEEVVAVLAEPQQWQEATVKTLLNRLLKKGAVRAEAEGRRYRYYPVLDQAQWKLDESRSLLDRLFGGRVAPLVAQFSESGRLSAADRRALQKLLKALDDE